jgi:hypothetical protein
MDLVRAVDVRRRLDAGLPPESPEAGVGPEAYVAALTGTFPDYTDPRILALQGDVMALSVAGTVDLCRRHGIDILAENGERVSFWTDVAVVLAARDRGLLPPV